MSTMVELKRIGENEFYMLLSIVNSIVS
jgi:hypothetical protein